MDFGALMMFRNPPPWRRPMQDVYRDLLELCVVAEELGFDHLWTSEHHFLDDGWSPSQLPILSAIAARTERIRIGTFVLLLPFHNPIRVAEDAATVDIISSGRFDLAVGPGSDPGDYATFGVPMLEEELKICPMTQMIFIIDHPGMNPRYIRSSLELLAKEVIPHFRR